MHCFLLVHPRLPRQTARMPADQASARFTQPGMPAPALTTSHIVTHLSTTPCSCVRLTSRRTVAGCPMGVCSWKTTRRTQSSSASCRKVERTHLWVGWEGRMMRGAGGEGQVKRYHMAGLHRQICRGRKVPVPATPPGRLLALPRQQRCTARSVPCQPPWSGPALPPGPHYARFVQARGCREPPTRPPPPAPALPGVPAAASPARLQTSCVGGRGRSRQQ